MELFKRFSRVLRFIGVFCGSYFLLSILYYWYLQLTDTGFLPDPVTQLVALQTEHLLLHLGYQAELNGIISNSLILSIDGQAVAQIIEGCNGISILILFIAFMLAFSRHWSSTFFYTLAGAALIYTVNLVRIVFLSIGLHKWPEYGPLLHEIIFPLIIYGTVFLLWLGWLRIFSLPSTISLQIKLPRFSRHPKPKGPSDVNL